MKTQKQSKLENAELSQIIRTVKNDVAKLFPDACPGLRTGKRHIDCMNENKCKYCGNDGFIVKSQKEKHGTNKSTNQRKESKNTRTKGVPLSTSGNSKQTTTRNSEKSPARNNVVSGSPRKTS